MKVLGIESSCDETSVAVIDINDRKLSVLCNITSSQMGIHKQFGGVVPEVAARNHAVNIFPVLQTALESTPVGNGADINLIAVTQGPGLMTSLAVGLQVAQTLAYLWQKPVVGVNHLEGHVLSPLFEHQIFPLKAENFPIIVLTVSGGHTQIIKVSALGVYEVIGSTIDDAAGEAFDKTAKMLGLGYPGGPIIDKMAKLGNPAKYVLPRPLLHSHDYRFSFSGLKTAVKYLIRDLGGADNLSSAQKNDIAASFQQAVVDVLVKKTILVAKEHSAMTVFLAGGVGANSGLREQLSTKCAQELGQRVQVVLIDRRYSGDNGAMIALAGYYQYQQAGATKTPLIPNPDIKWR